jgi:hypothetical protein
VISLDHHLIQGVAVEPVTPIEPPSETAET